MAFLLYLLMLLFISDTGAFKCYVCNSKNDIECVENLPKSLRLAPQDCQNITGAKFCIKTTNIYAGELGTKRFCAANDHGNFCKYIKQPTGNLEYRSCVLTCDSESCNNSRTIIDRQTAFYIATLLIVLSYILTTFMI